MSTRPHLRLGLLFVAGCGAIGAACVMRHTGSEPTAPPVPGAPPTSTGPFALGVNEGISVPTRLLGQPSGYDSLAADLASDGVELRRLGARLVRGHSGAFPRLSQWSLSVDPGRLETEGDTWVRAVQAAELEPVLMVSPWPANQTASVTDHYVPDDLDAYAAYVRRIVERYDADGVDDMPGLRGPVRYYEVDNEPDVKFNDAPRGARKPFIPGTFCTPAEYATVLVTSAQAIRSASPDAKVLAVGLFRPYAESGQAYLRALVAIPGVVEAIDILSQHTYQGEPDGRRMAQGLDASRQILPLRPVWITESSTSLGRGVDAQEQARLVTVLVGVAAVHGAERLFWHTLTDPPAHTEGPGAGAGGFATNSLMQTLPTGGREDKPAGTVFAHLARALATHDLVGAVADGVGAAKLRDGSVLLWEGERSAPTGGVLLRTGAPLSAGQRAEAPAFVW